MFSFNVYDLLAKNLTHNKDRIAIVDNNQELTYGELANRVNALACLLSSFGIQPGERVGIHLQKSVEEIIATFAIAKIGAVFVNINSQWSANQIQHVIRDCGIEFICTDYRRAKNLNKAGITQLLKKMIIADRKLSINEYCLWPETSQHEVETASTNDTKLAALIYTSGSTGLPKGVMLSHLNIVSGARSVASYLKNTLDDRILSILPMSFDYGMSQITTMFLVGGCVVLQPVSMASEIIKSIQTFSVTGLAAVPTLWIDIVHHLLENPVEFDTLRYLTNSGGKIPKGILGAMPSVFPKTEIYLMYGLTEAFRSTYLQPELFAEKCGSIGQAIPNSEIFVIDEEKGLCGPGEQGELVHAGTLVSSGYWGKPKETDAKIKTCPHLSSLLGEEKVLYSGDIVKIDNDGFLWFVSRMDSMIKTSGFRVSPSEIEEQILSSTFVDDVVAFGVDDEILGQVIYLVVSIQRTNSQDNALLLDYLRSNLPRYMIPKKIFNWHEKMPRNSNEKIDRQYIINYCLEEVVKETPSIVFWST